MSKDLLTQGFSESVHEFCYQQMCGDTLPSGTTSGPLPPCVLGGDETGSVMCNLCVQKWQNAIFLYLISEQN